MPTPQSPQSSLNLSLRPRDQLYHCDFPLNPITHRVPPLASILRRIPIASVINHRCKIMLQPRSAERARPSMFRAVEEECPNSFLDHFPYRSRNTCTGCGTDDPKASGKQTAPILNHRRDAPSHKARDSARDCNDKPLRRRCWLSLCLRMAIMGKVVPHRPSQSADGATERLPFPEFLPQEGCTNLTRVDQRGAQGSGSASRSGGDRRPAGAGRPG